MSSELSAVKPAAGQLHTPPDLSSLQPAGGSGARPGMGVGVTLGLGLGLACEFLLLDLGVQGEAVSWPLLTRSRPSLPGAPVCSPPAAGLLPPRGRAPGRSAVTPHQVPAAALAGGGLLKKVPGKGA